MNNKKIETIKVLDHKIKLQRVMNRLYVDPFVRI